MSKPFLLAAAAGALTVLASTASAAQVDYFLKIDGIDGESADHKHKGEIEILSFSWGATNTGSLAGGGAGKVKLEDVHFVASVNKASPKLFLTCATGQHIKKATLTLRKAGQEQQHEFYKVTLTDILVSSYQSSGSGDGLPVDQFSLNFAKIEYSYIPTGDDGRAHPAFTAVYDRFTGRTK